MTEQRQPAIASARLYAENYQVLADVADKLRSGGPEDVDGLVDDFRRAMGAYRICQDRLDAIRAEIDAEVDRLGPDQRAAP